MIYISRKRLRTTALMLNMDFCRTAAILFCRSFFVPYLYKKHHYDIIKSDFCLLTKITFFLLYYTGKDVMYYLRLCELLVFWERMQNGGRKSFRFDELNPDYFFQKKNGIMVPYLDMIQKDLNDR